MLKPVDLTFMDEPTDDPGELLKAWPEIRYEMGPAPADDDLGLRSLLEQPEAFTHAWWRDQASRGTSSTRPTHRPAP
jgi:hypothetical protein